MSIAIKNNALDQLKAFGYGFNEKGELRKIDKTTNELTDKPYKSNTPNRLTYMHNEKLSTYIDNVVFEMLEEHGLKRTYIPENLPPKKCSFFYSQPEALNGAKKLLVLIYGGSGNCGQWSRHLIISKSLEHGSQLPYIRRAQELGYAILIMNVYDNYRLINGKKKPIEQLNDARSHAEYIWRRFVVPAEPESVAIVAHAYAGQLVCDLAALQLEFFKAKVFAIALLDATYWDLKNDVFATIGNYTCNWIKGDEPVNTVITNTVRKYRIRHLSAGKESKEHDVPYAALNTVFEFLEEKLREFEGKRLNDVKSN